MPKESNVLKVVNPRFKKVEPQTIINKVTKFFKEYLLFTPEEAFFEIKEYKIEFNVHFKYLNMTFTGAKITKKDEVVLIAKQDKKYYLKIV